MEPFDQKETYLEQLKMQIRCKKARDMVAEEFEQHIEDQKAFFITAGDDEKTALKKAIEQMGDPAEVGKQLDKIHRPRLEWRILLAVLGLCCFGVFTQLSIKNSIDESVLSYSVEIGRHVAFLVMGFCIMVGVYFFDYTIIGKYAKVIWLLLIAAFLVSPFFMRTVNGRLPYWNAISMMFIPLFGGIIYQYRNKGYAGIIKCLLISLVTSMLELRMLPQVLVFLALILSSLIMLSIAVWKNWFGKRKKIEMAVLWGWIPCLLVVSKLFHVVFIKEYQIMRLHYFINLLLHSEQSSQAYGIKAIKNIMTHSKILGGSTEYIAGYLPGLSSDYILTYVVGKWGIASGVLMIGLFAVLMGRMFSISIHQKNSLGMFIMTGCSMAISIQGVIYILANFGISLIAQGSLPFVSYGGSSLFINFFIMGLLLSVFRNTEIIKEISYSIQ